MLANQETRFLNQDMFNDQITELYLVICIYLLLVKGNPVLASLFYTLGLSIKAGALLLLPSLLGWIQYQHGTKNLLASTMLIIGFQVAIVAPICHTPTA